MNAKHVELSQRDLEAEQQDRETAGLWLRLIMDEKGMQARI